MKEELINIIDILGVDCDEIIIDIDLGFFLINSIEIRGRKNIILHHFSDILDYELNYNDISLGCQSLIYETVATLLYN